MILQNPLNKDVSWKSSLEGYEGQYTIDALSVKEFPDPVALRLIQCLIDETINERHLKIVSDEEIEQIKKDLIVTL